MLIFPAIDLVGGKAVRLFQGDYDKMTVYNDDPAAAARAFQDAGAQYLHVVDLEPATAGRRIWKASAPSSPEQISTSRSAAASGTWRPWSAIWTWACSG